MKKYIRNYTRHNITIRAHLNHSVYGLITKMLEITPEETPVVVRFHESVIQSHRVQDDCAWHVDVYEREYTGVNFVPKQIPGTFIVVSAPVAASPALKGRKDVLVPYKVKHDSRRRVTGCEGLKPGPGVPVHLLDDKISVSPGGAQHEATVKAENDRRKNEALKEAYSLNRSIVFVPDKQATGEHTVKTTRVVRDIQRAEFEQHSTGPNKGIGEWL